MALNRINIRQCVNGGNKMITRKEFLTKSAQTGGLILVSAVAGADFLNTGLFADDKPEKGGGVLDPGSFKIIKSATRAPSGHNSQPWTIKIISKNEWIIGWDKSRALPAVDPYNRELLLSIGAFCEALKISAKNEGLDSEIEITGSSLFSDDLAKIKFRESAKSGIFSQELQKRKTIKNGLISRSIDKADIESILAGLSSKIQIIHKGSGEGSFIEEMVLESNIIQTEREDAQKELASWIRWSDKDVEKYSNGLSPAGMGMEGIAAWYVKNFYNSDTVMTGSFKDATISQVKKHLSSYGSWILITSKNEDVPALINTGQDFLKLALNSYNKKISLHPMTQPLEEGFGNDLQKRLGISEKIQFILRCGYVKRYSEPVSVRMSPERIML